MRSELQGWVEGEHNSKGLTKYGLVIFCLTVSILLEAAEVFVRIQLASGLLGHRGLGMEYQGSRS